MIGIEGVSCTGKTTLAAALGRRLAATMPGPAGGACVVPCYYHAAPDPRVLSDPDVRDEAGQLAALAALLDVEQLRSRQARGALGQGRTVVLDRTVDTLLAHVRGVGRMRGLDATVPARALVNAAISRGDVAVPAVTLLLEAGHEALARRAAARPGLPILYYDEDFTCGFNGYFADPITPRCLAVDAAAGADDVAEQAWGLLKPYVDGAR
jgi:thymidylate kinase